jgi:hypothetical protein
VYSVDEYLGVVYIVKAVGEFHVFGLDTSMLLFPFGVVCSAVAI